MSSDKTQEQQARIDKILANLCSSTAGRALLGAGLEKQGFGLMKVISKDAFPTIDDPVRLAMAKKGIILDVETTGLDTTSDEIIELAMVEFFYDEDGIIALGEVYDEFNEPKKKEIDEEVCALTGITNEMVKGKSIDPKDVAKIVADCSMVLAHHAGFDRKMVELNLPDCGFEGVDWHCSVNEVEWILRGKNGRSLEVLALSEGYVYGSHRADSDCLATAFVLMSEDEKGRTAFSELLENGSKESILLIADGAPYGAKDLLKDRGYKWADGTDGSEAYGHKAWHKQIPADLESIEEEAAFMRDDVYHGDKSLPSFRVQPSTRYSARKPGEKELFHTKPVTTIMEASKQMNLEMSDPEM